MKKITQQKIINKQIIKYFVINYTFKDCSITGL